MIRLQSPVVQPKKERWTYTDYLSLPPDSSGYQIIRGELLVTPSPKRNHQWVVQRLFALLEVHINRNGLGELYIAPFDVILDADAPEPENIVQPDLLFVATDRLPIVTEDNVKGAPDLAVEIQSGSTARYDRVHKLRLYAEFGVKHYWIADPEAHTLEAFDLTGDTPRLAASHAENETFRPALFPGLEIHLGELWYTPREQSP